MIALEALFGGEMQTKHKAGLILGVLALLMAVTPASWAQVNSNQATVNLNAVLGESLTVTASPGTVNFTLAASGPSTGSVPVAITTAWALGSSRTKVNLFAYFTTANALTDGAGHNIPSANVSGSVNSGAFATFTTAGAFSTQSLQVFLQALAAGTFNSSRSDNLDRKSTRLNSSHLVISYAVFCLKKKKKRTHI